MVGSGSDVKIGAPLVEGGKVTAEVVAHGRHDKIRIVKFNRRKHHRKETVIASGIPKSKSQRSAADRRLREMAHKKAGGSTRNGRDSESKRLGVKAWRPGCLSRQHHCPPARGTRFHAAENVRVGKDHTLYATADGTVEFFNGGPQNRKQVRIVTA